MSFRRLALTAAAIVTLALPAVAQVTKQTPPGGAGAKQPPTPPGGPGGGPGAGKKGDGAKQPPRPVEPPAPKAPEFNYAMLRIDQLEQQLAERIASQRTNDAVTNLAVAADINFRIAAVSLLRVGVSRGVDGAVAILYGHTLADHADDAQKLFNDIAGKIKSGSTAAVALPGVAAGAQPTGPLPKSALVDVLQKFNADADAAFGTIRDASEREVEQYLQKIMLSLAAVGQAAGMPLPVDTWVVVTSRQTGEPAAVQQAITDKDLDVLARRIQAAPLSTMTKNEMTFTVDRMKRGWNQAELRPQLLGMYEPLFHAVDVAEALAAATWIGDNARADLTRQLEVGVMLVNDPRLRTAAVERFDTMSRSLVLVKQITDLDKQQVPVDSMRNLYLAAQQLASKKADVRTANRLIEYLETLTGLMLEARGIKVETLPLELKRTAQALQKEHQQAELDLLKKLPDLQTTPALIEDPAWTEALRQLTDRIELTRRVAAVQEWTDRLLKYKPKNSTRLGITLRGIAGSLMTPTRRPVAQQQLRALERQIQQFDPMPREQLLRTPSPATQALVGDSLRMIVDQLDRLRSEWATHWANGTDPAESVEKLRKMSRLIDAIHSTSGLADADAVIERLNRWGAWQGRVDALKPLMKTMADRISAAAKLAGSADWSTLEATITQVQHEAPLPMLIVRLDGTIGQQLAALPDGLNGCLSQSLYGPRQNSFAAAYRLELAQISAYLLEAAHAAGNVLPGEVSPQLDAILTYGGYQARNVMDGLDGKARPKPEAPAPSAAGATAPANAPAPPAPPAPPKQ